MRYLLLLLITFISLSTTALAKDTKLTVTFGYTPPDNLTVASYSLYYEDLEGLSHFVVNLTESSPGVLIVDASTIPIVDSLKYTLTAVFEDGSESPHSTPFPFAILTQPKLNLVSKLQDSTPQDIRMITMDFEYSDTVDISGFSFYYKSPDGAIRLLDKVYDKSIRTWTGKSPVSIGKNSFYVSAFKDSTVLGNSNVIAYEN